MLQIDRLTVENLAQGCVTDSLAPRIAYTVSSPRPGASLKSAQVAINGWQTQTTDQISVPYAGPSLAPFTTYPVQLTVTDDGGETATAETCFETGRLGTPWLGRWITDTSYQFTTKKDSPLPMSFRRQLSCKKPVVRARLYATALGVYELSLNGQKVGQDYFAPGLTSYEHTLQYQTYDVTPLLKAENTLCALVAGGWAVGAFTFSRANRITAPRQAFLAELHISYADGTQEVIGTDEAWQVSLEDRLRYADFYDGEVFDATIDPEKIAWRQAGYETVKIKPQLVATYGSLVRAHELMKPISCQKSPSGVWIYDFGQNFAGVIHAVIRGKQGQVVTFKHTELLMEGELYLEPLRSAKVQAVYTCTQGQQTYSPRQTYMGFRYVGVTGIQPEDLELTALALYSDLPLRGEFECSNPLVNRLQQNILWSTKSNFMDIPTDCPQRDERMGWTGDIALFAPTASFNFDTRRFLEKWLADVKAQQRPGGGINVVIPVQGFNYPFAVEAFWGDCCILVPWAMYQAYGDVEILKTMYPVMEKYLKAVKFWAGWACVGRTNRHTKRWWHEYGDWVAPGVSMWRCMNRGLWTATACWAHSCDLMAQIATLLNKPQDRTHYLDLKSEINRAYQKRFLDDAGRMKRQHHPFSVHALGKEGEFQSGYVLPIAFNMLSGKAKEGALQNLVRLVKENDYHIGTGFPGTPFILFALADNGYEDIAYKMLMTDTCPSWLYEAKAGGTTIWERWDGLREDGSCNTGADDGTNGMTSFNHYASGAVGDFLYRRVAGIQMTSPGYKTFAIKPLVGGGLTWAKAQVNSSFGQIACHWRIENNSFIIQATVPMSCVCTLTLPNGQYHTLQSGRHTFTIPWEAENS